MESGDTFILGHKVAGYPEMATILFIQGFSVFMEGQHKGVNKKFCEHVCRFQGKNARWKQQLSLFENKESSLSKKYLK